MSLVSRLTLLFILLLGTCVRAQESGCYGDSFVQVLRDDAGEDLRATCVIPYPGGTDLLVGGTIGGNIFLTRIGRNGTLRWRRIISTPSLSTELSTLAGMLVDEEGMIAGAGSTFDADNVQRSYVFRYDPLSDQVRYLHQPPFPSEATGITRGDTGEYLLSGSKKGEPEPIFDASFVVRINRQTGLPVSGTTYDLGGDESFLDYERQPDGGAFACGRSAATGGTGASRASLSRLGPSGNLLWTRAGYAPPEANARLLAFDVEVVGSTVYLLSWGNVGVITGSIGTAMVLSAFDLDGTPQWSRRYDIENFDGEEAIDLIRHEDGLLAYGFNLIGRRQPFLVHTGLDGDLRWAKTYDLPRTATLYFRCNQQVMSDADGLVILASYSGDGRPREGVLLGLDADGNSTNPCLGVDDLTVSVTGFAAAWPEITLVEAPQTTPWSPSPSAPVAETIAIVDDCDVPCDDCFERAFARRAICRGESLTLGGVPRFESGVYADTVPGILTGCDSIFLTELAVSDGPEATVSVRRNCGLSTADVQLTVTGGEFPYSYNWSVEGASGPRVSLPAGTYAVTVNDALACNPRTVSVTVGDAPITGPDFRFDSPFCPGDSTGRIRLEPAGSGSLRLLPDGAFTDDRIEGLAAGSYLVLLRDTTGCEAFRQVTIDPARPAAINIDAPTTVRLGDEVTLRATNSFGSFFSNFTWSANDSITCGDCPVASFRPSATGIVSVLATTERGCPVSDSLLIRVTTGPARVFVPTGFSPNGDEVNDRWVPGLGPEVARITKWQVYDRWGNLRWVYPGDESWWDGSGAPAGVYTYTLSVTLTDGRSSSTSGALTLVR